MVRGWTDYMSYTATETEAQWGPSPWPSRLTVKLDAGTAPPTTKEVRVDASPATVMYLRTLRLVTDPEVEAIILVDCYAATYATVLDDYQDENKDVYYSVREIWGGYIRAYALILRIRAKVTLTADRWARLYYSATSHERLF